MYHNLGHWDVAPEIPLKPTCSPTIFSSLNHESYELFGNEEFSKKRRQSKTFSLTLLSFCWFLFCFIAQIDDLIRWDKLTSFSFSSWEFIWKWDKQKMNRTTQQYENFFVCGLILSKTANLPTEAVYLPCCVELSKVYSWSQFIS